MGLLSQWKLKMSFTFSRLFSRMLPIFKGHFWSEFLTCRSWFSLSVLNSPFHLHHWWHGTGLPLGGNSCCLCREAGKTLLWKPTQREAGRRQGCQRSRCLTSPAENYNRSLCRVQSGRSVWWERQRGERRDIQEWREWWIPCISLSCFWSLLMESRLERERRPRCRQVCHRLAGIQMLWKADYTEC